MEENYDYQYLDEKVYVKTCGLLQKRVLVTIIVHRKATKDVEKIMKNQKDHILFAAIIFANFASLW